MSHSAPNADFRDLSAFDALEDGRITPFSLDGAPVVLIRDGEKIHAFAGKCPHKEAPLEQGAFCRTEKGSVLVCPWHKAVFDATDGSLVEPLALDPLQRYPAQIVDGRVLVGLKPMQRVAPAKRQEGDSVLLLGAGAAAVSAAVTLRAEGFAGTITMVSEEKDLPYDRTALSKTVLVSESEKAHAPPVREEEFYTERDITRIRGHVAQFDPQTRTATLQDGTKLAADHVLIATGAVTKKPDIPGVDMKGVYTLHREADAERIAAILDPDLAVTIVGAGFIGLEAASSLRQRGVGVTVVSDNEIPMEKQFGREIGIRLRQLHEENGVAFVSDARVTKIYADESDGEKASGVELDDGTRLPAAFVLLGVGVIPATDYVLGLERDKSGAIVVNGQMRVTRGDDVGAYPGVYAAGDASAVFHDGAPRRIEHWRHAEVQGRIAALAMMGHDTPNVPMPWFWTQQFGKKIELLGWGESFDNVALEGDIRGFRFLATYLKDGKPIALAGAGHAADMARAAVDFDGFMKEKA
ncbi:FAD-dependent oxidoreductase [Gluconobacter kondonii]|uniref:Pyridine nucleotide-disulfide oxidoreductase n=1 Tax=Gluconobacter kondonii TaxID=941463 RepID=A0ABQ5WNG9_9PROT|nr:FAD-dependent oxidoreductase [Gluconobacter kondonii]MCP1235008.1 FAD-dependent oxidoreductase [Gluconobacter kondonii]GBR33180.1 rubredoxin-NAD reductase [Gluconobacter kondonii NBRC 3266]GLQ64804.1 pyridine nucleotide-disulfide oxidoreductase [Gluconobacter kondonii]